MAPTYTKPALWSAWRHRTRRQNTHSRRNEILADHCGYFCLRKAGRLWGKEKESCCRFGPVGREPPELSLGFRIHSRACIQPDSSPEPYPHNLSGWFASSHHHAYLRQPIGVLPFPPCWFLSCSEDAMAPWKLFPGPIALYHRMLYGSHTHSAQGRANRPSSVLHFYILRYARLAHSPCMPRPKLSGHERKFRKSVTKHTSPFTYFLIGLTHNGNQVCSLLCAKSCPFISL